MDNNKKKRDEILDGILQYYKKRKSKISPGAASRETKLIRYREAFLKIGVPPLGERRLLDVGCFTGNWLVWACNEWGGKLENCWGVELRSDVVERGRQMYPGIQLMASSADKLQFPDEHFDIAHHSMMFSSIPDETLRKDIATEMWRVLKRGGYVAWFDYIWNPFNRNVCGMRKKNIFALFPDAEWTYCKRIVLAPPIARFLNVISDRAIFLLEKARILNAYYLCLLRKPK